MKTGTQLDTTVYAPYGENRKPKVVAKLRGRLDLDTAIAEARAELRLQMEEIQATLDQPNDEWRAVVTAKGDATQVRLVGNGLVAFPPDLDAASTDDGVPNEGDQDQDENAA